MWLWIFARASGKCARSLEGSRLDPGAGAEHPPYAADALRRRRSATAPVADIGAHTLWQRGACGSASSGLPPARRLASDLGRKANPSAHRGLARAPRAPRNPQRWRSGPPRPPGCRQPRAVHLRRATRRSPPRAHRKAILATRASARRDFSAATCAGSARAAARTTHAGQPSSRDIESLSRAFAMHYGPAPLGSLPPHRG